MEGSFGVDIVKIKSNYVRVRYVKIYEK